MLDHSRVGANDNAADGSCHLRHGRTDNVGFSSLHIAVDDIYAIEIRQ